ncbi:MAG: hypothetical protein ACK5OW_01350 [bacterium]
MPYEIDPKNKKCVRKADSKKRVGCTKGSVKKYLTALRMNVSESEMGDFEWAEETISGGVDLNNPEVLFTVLEDTFKNSNFKIVKNGGIYHIEDQYGDIYSYISKNDFNLPFIYHDIKDNITFLTGEGDNDLLPYYRRLLNLIRHLYKNNINQLFKPINETEDDFSWFDLDSGVRLGDLWQSGTLKVGDVIFISGDVYDGEGKLLTTFNKELFEVTQIIVHGDDHRMKFKWVDNTKEKPNDWKDVLSYENTIIVDGLIDSDFKWIIEPVTKSINESEEGEFGWVEDILDNPINMLVKGGVYLVNHRDKDEWGLNVKVLDFTSDTVSYIRRVTDNGDQTLNNSENIIGRSRVDKLITRNYWQLIPTKTSLFSDTIKESEDNFGWAEDIIEKPFLDFTGKELLIDVRGFTEEEREELYQVLKGYIDFDYGREHRGDWNPKCIIDNYNLKSVCLHCGTEDFDYEPQRGHICCLSNTYDEQPAYTKANIIPIDGKILLGKNNLNEAEKISSDDFGWAEDIIHGDAIGINIQGKDDFIRNLKPGSVLKISGDQDGLFFYDEMVEVVSNFPSSDDRATNLKLIKFSGFLATDDADADMEGTHCGGISANDEIKSKCECENYDEGVNQDMGIGRCWWVDLKHSVDEISFYPSKSNITESKNKKPLLKEGRYDRITSSVVRDIMELVKTNEEGYFYLPDDVRDELYYEQEGLSFSVEITIKKTEDPITFEVGTITVGDEEYDEEYDENVLEMSILLGTNFNRQNFESLFYKLQEDVRHEIEHFTQEGPDRIKDRPKSKEKTSELPPFEHHTHITEIPALVHGFYRRAKLERRPLDEIMVEDLDDDIAKGNLTKEQASQILTLWIDYAKKHLPHAQYSGEY